MIWNETSNGKFNAKSTYNLACDSNEEPSDARWIRLCKLQLPDKLKSFLWLVRHERLHSNQLRALISCNTKESSGRSRSLTQVRDATKTQN